MTHSPNVRDSAEISKLAGRANTGSLHRAAERTPASRGRPSLIEDGLAMLKALVG
jgi:hypothetical protein